MTSAPWANKGGPQWIQNQTSMKVHHWSSLLDLKGFKNLSPSPVVLPHKDPCLLPIDGVCSLLDMHGNSIIVIFVLHRSPAFCHMDFQCSTSPGDIFSLCNSFSNCCQIPCSFTVKYEEGF